MMLADIYLQHLCTKILSLYSRHKFVKIQSQASRRAVVALAGNTVGASVAAVVDLALVETPRSLFLSSWP